jgi:hypothetical protein
MDINRITDYKSLKREKARLKEKLEFNKQLIEFDVEKIKKALSPLNILKELVTSPEFKSQLMHTSIQYGIDKMEDIVTHKHKTPSFLGSLGKNLFFSFAPYYLGYGARLAASFINKKKARSYPEMEVTGDKTIINESDQK